MSLRYLYNKLEKMNTREQYCYIQNVFFRFQIRPNVSIDEIFEDTEGKQTSGKNPLGYLVMNLTKEQLQKLVPDYFRELIGVGTFTTQDDIIMNIIDSTIDAIEFGDTYIYSPYKSTQAEMLQVFQFGVGKYSEWSFLKLNPLLLVPAMFRHLYKYFNVAHLDEETGISHLAHAECNKRMIQLIIEKGKQDES